MERSRRKEIKYHLSEHESDELLKQGEDKHRWRCLGFLKNLYENEQQELVEVLPEGRPWKSQEVQHLLQEEFGVEYHSNYLRTFLRNLGPSQAKPRPERPR